MSMFLMVVIGIVGFFLLTAAAVILERLFEPWLPERFTGKYSIAVLAVIIGIVGFAIYLGYLADNSDESQTEEILDTLFDIQTREAKIVLALEEIDPQNNSEATRMVEIFATQLAELESEKMGLESALTSMAPTSTTVTSSSVPTKTQDPTVTPSSTPIPTQTETPLATPTPSTIPSPTYTKIPLAAPTLSTIPNPTDISPIILSLWNPEYLSCGDVLINGFTSTSDGNVTGITWNWGDGTENDSYFPASHHYDSNGIYMVAVRAHSSSHETRLLTTTVTIDCHP